MLKFIYLPFTRCLYGLILKFYQISFASHLPDSDRVRLQFVYVNFARFFVLRLRSFTMLNLVNAQRCPFCGKSQLEVCDSHRLDLYVVVLMG